MTYTREQLIGAQKIYDKNYLKNPEKFGETDGTFRKAEASIDYLLSLVK